MLPRPTTVLLSPILALAGADRSSAQVCPNLEHVLASHPVGSEPWCAAGGDVDGDGADDLFVGCSPLFSSGSLSFLRNAGNGLFLAGIGLPGVESPRSLALADIDGDGDPDLLVADQGVYSSGSGTFQNDGVLVFGNDGQGHFAAPRLFPFAGNDDLPEALRTGDLDGDGDLDVVLAVRHHRTGPLTADSRVLAFVNDGRGNLAPTGSWLVDPQPRGLVLADLDGDQVLDAATVNWESGSVSVTFGHGDGTFDALPNTYAAGIYASTLAAADFDGDGEVDLAVGWKYGVRVLLNQGNGSFASGSTHTFGYYPKAMAACDFDQDGRQDLIVTFASSADAKLLRGSGSASFSTFASHPCGAQAYALALGDWNGDEILDFATADDDGSTLRVWSSDCGTSSYCQAKVNSQGCAPTIGFLGTPSATSGLPFQITAEQVLNRVNGLLIYGYHSAELPFQGGLLCVAPPVRRTAPQGSGGSPSGVDCSGSFSIDFNARIRSGADPGLVAGARVFAQYWSRDPADPSGFGSSLTDALTFTIEP